MFRKIFQRLFFIITQPTKTWNVLDEEDVNNEKFLSHYIYPILGMVAIAAFLGSFISDKSLELALKASLQEFVAYFAGFYLASLLMKELMIRKFGNPVPERYSYFVAYASSLIYVISILISLLGFHLLLLFLPYTIYMIWEGAIPYMKVKEEDQVKFTSFATLIVCIPYLIALIINRFMLITPHATN